MVSPLASLQFPVVIPQVEIPQLGIPTIVAPGTIESASRGSSTTPFALMFDPIQFVKTKDFNRLEAKTTAFME